MCVPRPGGLPRARRHAGRRYSLYSLASTFSEHGWDSDRARARSTGAAVGLLGDRG